jgi:transcriptional regulator with XRE-family HTH domain
MILVMIESTKIKELREARGMSTRVFAREAGISTETLHAIEHGRRQPSMTTLDKIARARARRTGAIDAHMQRRTIYGDGVPEVAVSPPLKLFQQPTSVVLCPPLVPLSTNRVIPPNPVDQGHDERSGHGRDHADHDQSEPPFRHRYPSNSLRHHGLRGWPLPLRLLPCRN